ncbi:MAG: hypothetical protein KDM81_18580, partial [Verrucomicrobiae bacterium]|nr:hypothetical protein [Verrucomicrobiae bacterium]
ATLEIIDILSKFEGRKVTYVNAKAYSAGAFISVATEAIYMAPESVIGAAAPIMMSPGGTGVEEMPSTVEVKMTSALSAKIRAYAQKYGHNTQVVNAMINKQTELIIDGKTLNEKGQILTLTNREAAEEYGDPPKPLLSAGTVDSLDAVIAKLGETGAKVTRIEPTGAERLATWLTALNWLWLIIGVAGIYLEIKTPGFGLPGIAGICGFALYFLGSYVAGLSGLEWAVLFVVGLILVALEIFVWPGTVVPGLAGLGLIFVSLVMALVDMYPGMPAVPTLPQLRLPLRDLGIAAIGSVAVIVILARLLPKTPFYPVLVSQDASGVTSVRSREAAADSRVGREGIALSPLHPGGKAQFGEEIIDVTTQGEMIDRGAPVRILRHSLGEAVVERVK